MLPGNIEEIKVYKNYYRRKHANAPTIMKIQPHKVLTITFPITKLKLF